MFYPFNRLPFSESNRLASAVVGVSLAAIGTAIYLSPAKHHGPTVPGTSAAQAIQSSLKPNPAPSSTTPSASAKPNPSVKPNRPPYRVIHVPGQNKLVVLKETQTHTITTTAPSKAATPLKCGSFKWQQDAQAAYLANLSDPWGLDGKPGPNNGDGIACNDEPVDPSRPKSVPAGAYAPPTPSPASKAALVAPAKKYFGVAMDGLPGDSGMFDRLATEVGKAPSLVEWFANWPQAAGGVEGDFRGDLVTSAWTRGALPVISWQSGNGDGSATDPYRNRLAEIVSGTFDDFLLRYAGDIVRTNLAVAIRFDHEMNGNWYDWSAGYPWNQSSVPGQPNLYVQAWRHIWSVFNSVGANDNVIWTWTPDRVDGLKPGCSSGNCIYQTGLAEDYPGDQYVDWIGMSGYAWKPPASGWSYNQTYLKTFTQLKSLAGSDGSKPIFIAETGASQKVGAAGTDATTQKVAWINQALAGIVNDPRVVGLAYFNNNITHVHSIEGVQVETNWTLDSAPEVLAAFKAGIADNRYSSGIMPDSAGR
jgi:hypothetical protein